MAEKPVSHVVPLTMVLLEEGGGEYVCVCLCSWSKRENKREGGREGRKESEKEKKSYE